MNGHIADSWSAILLWCNIPEITRLWACGDSWLQEVMRKTPQLVGCGVYQLCLKEMYKFQELDLSNDTLLTDQLLCQLPAQLTSLTISNIDLEHDPEFRFECLPVTLTRLHIKTLENRWFSFHLLPPLLTELKVEGGPVEPGANWDPAYLHLQHLTMSYTSMPFLYRVLHACPNLTRINITYTGPLTPQDTTEVIWPKSLQEIHYYSENNILPQGLTTITTSAKLHITIRNVRIFKLEDQPWYPINLVELNFLEILLTLNDQVTNTLPVTLTSLSIGYLDYYSRKDDKRDFARLRNLTHLTVKSRDHSHLPLDLTRCSSSLVELTTDNCSHVLVPNSVTRLSILTTKHFTAPFYDRRGPLTTRPFDNGRVPSTNPTIRNVVRRVDSTPYATPDLVVRISSSTQTVIDHHSSFTTLIGVNYKDLSGLPINIFNQLTHLEVNYHQNLSDLLQQLPVHLLRKLVIVQSSDGGVGFFDRALIPSITGIEGLLEACCRFYQLRSLTVITPLISQPKGSIGKLIHLPSALTELSLSLCAALYELSIPPSLEVLILRETYVFNNNTRRGLDQLEMLKHTSLRRLDLYGEFSAKVLWKIFESLPLSVNSIIYRGHNSYSFTREGLPEKITPYTQSRKRFLDLMAMN